MEVRNKQAAPQPKRRRTRKALWLGLFVVLAVVGGWWVWRKMQFSLLRIPLIQAVQNGNVAQVRDLLDQGADPNVSIDYQPEPFNWSSLLRMLGGDRTSSASEANTVLIEATARNRADIVRLLVDYGADVNRPRKDGTTALLAATTSDHPASLPLLLKHGAKANVHDDSGMSALMWATFYGHPDAVQALLAAEADINAQSLLYGQTALHIAVGEVLPGDGISNKKAPAAVKERRRYLALIKLLIERGADTRLKDGAGQTVLQYAQEYHDAELTDLLRKTAARAPRAGKEAGR